MDPRKRIAELEEQVRQLQARLRAMAGHGGGGNQQRPPQRRPEGRPPQAQREGTRQGAPPQRPSPPRAPAATPTRLSGIWLGRLGVFLLLAVVALGAAAGWNMSELAAWQRVAAGYGLTLLLIAYGAVTRNTGHWFGETSLALGLTGLFVLTFAAMHHPFAQVFSPSPWGAAWVAGALLVYVVAANWRHAWLPVVLPAFLGYLLLIIVVRGFAGAQEASFTAYVSGLALLFACCALFSFRRYRVALWLALGGHYLLAAHFDGAIPGDPLSLTFTAAGFAALSLAAGFSSPRESAMGWERIAFSLLNTLLFILLAFPAEQAARPWPPSAQWAALAGILALAAIHAAWRRRQRAPLAEVFLAKAGIAGAIALVLLTREPYHTAVFAGGAFAFVLVRLFTGMRAAAFLNTLYIAAAVAAMLLQGTSGAVFRLGEAVMPASWAAAGMAAVLLTASATALEHVRVSSSTAPPWSGQGAANAGAAALILLTCAMLETGQHPGAPFFLASLAVFVLILGALCFSAAVRGASFLVLAGAHATYYMYMWLEPRAFMDQPGFLALSVILAALTAGVGPFWERLLPEQAVKARALAGLTAALPYLMAGVLVIRLALLEIPAVYLPLALQVLAGAILVAGFFTGRLGLKACGLLVAAAAAATFLNRLYTPDGTLVALSWNGAYYASFAALYVAAERFGAWAERQKTPRTGQQGEDAVRTLLVGAAGLVGVLTLAEWAPALHLSLYWGGLGLGAMLLGFCLDESRYRWTGLFILAAALGRVFVVDLWHLPSFYATLSAAALAVSLLVISSLYSHAWIKTLRRRMPS